MRGEPEAGARSQEPGARSQEEGGRRKAARRWRIVPLVTWSARGLVGNLGEDLGATREELDRGTVGIMGDSMTMG